MGILLYPEGESPDNRTSLAPRGYPTLSGLTLGLLINGKRNSDHLLQDLAQLIGEHYRLKSLVTLSKPSHGRVAPTSTLDQLATECDVVITAMGDCGSCSASTVADAIILERRGIPSVAVCAEGFTAAASAMARREGVQDYHYITLPQPFSSLTREQVRERAERILPEVLSILGITEAEIVTAG